jgi:adenosylhomocysteine nucleosidase
MPLPKERAFLDATLRAAGFAGVLLTDGPVEATHFPDIDVITAHGGHGKTQLAVQTRYILDTLAGIDYVICAGAAGALAEGLEIGDIVLGETTIEHDYRVRFSSRPLPAFPGDPALLQRFRGLAATAGLACHTGTIASGDEDVIELERGVELAALTGAIAVAWEGAGAARACTLTSVPWLEVRGITDTADHTASSDFHINLELAMSNIAMLVAAWGADSHSR